MIELELGDQFQNWMMRPGVTGWRLEGSLREFPNFVPVNFWFEYPIHRMDLEQALKGMPSQGSFETGQMKSKYHKSSEMAKEEFRNAYQMLNTSGEGVPMQEMMDYLQLAERTIRNRINTLSDEFCLDAGTVKTIDPKAPRKEDLQANPKRVQKSKSKKARKVNDIVSGVNFVSGDQIESAG